jgi:16S rRNA (cytosine1402-N4)-methyltransferase
MAETLHWLAPVPGAIYVDGTLGLGGHSRAILEQSAPDGRVIGFEWDEEALARVRETLAPYKDRLIIVRRNFAELAAGLAELGITAIDGLLLDIGLSSLQLDGGTRGFSFKGNEPLDMRMDNRTTTTAADLINEATEEELANIFYDFGEERQSRRIAARIVEERQQERIDTTAALARIVAEAVPRRFHPRHIHVATKVFQALRIAVNRELHNLVRVLADGVELLQPGGRFVVITFHSLEDRLVKRAFRDHPELRVLTKKPVVPNEAESHANPRARSAKLRAAEKIRTTMLEEEK